MKFSVFDELLFNLLGTTQHHFFDHDRIGLNLEYHIFPDLKFDIGYMHITRGAIISGIDSLKISENNIILNLTYQLHRPGNERSKVQAEHPGDIIGYKAL